MARSLLVAAAGLFAATLAFADSPMPAPERSVNFSPRKKYCAVADPKSDTITVFSVENKKPKERLWEIKGFHWDVLLSDDGQHLIVGNDELGLLASDDPKQELYWLYDRGKLIRTWRLEDLVPAHGKLERTVSHWHWLVERSLDAKGRFYVNTVAGKFYFDSTTGQRIEAPGR